jgi:TonB family protein
MTPTIPHQFPAWRLGLLGLAFAFFFSGPVGLAAEETPASAKIKPPVPTNRVAPVHPAEFVKKLVNGQALVECLVTETGAVKEVKTLSATEPEFGLAAEDALWQWEFRPGEQDGRPVPVRLQIPFDFKITLEQILEMGLKRRVFQEIKDLIVPASELPAWPRPLQFLLPRYPESLKGSGKYGKAVVALVIDKEGKVLNPTIVKTTYPEFILPALATAARLEFPPQVMANNVHIYVSMTIQFDFKPDSDKPLIKDKPKSPEKSKKP